MATANTAPTVTTPGLRDVWGAVCTGAVATCNVVVKTATAAEKLAESLDNYASWARDESADFRDSAALTREHRTAAFRRSLPKAA